MVWVCGEDWEKLEKIIKKDLEVNKFSIDMILDIIVVLFDVCSWPHLVGKGLVIVFVSKYLQTS